MNFRSIIPGLILMVILPLSCKQSKEASSQVDTSPAINAFDGNAGLLLDQLRKQGDYVNSRQFPSMIKAPTVYEELDSNNHIIDLRREDFFDEGHIEGAVNVRMDAILDHFENEIVPFQYDKIVLICYSGHIAAYTTHLLRLLGYGNVYSMRWGMSSWNTDFARDFWLMAVSSEYQDRLETEINPKPEKYMQPVILGSATSGEALLRERIAELLEAGMKEAFSNAEEAFEGNEEYFIINFERRDKYESGHIPGAIRYKPQGTLGIPSEMSSIPTDRPVIVYCGTGQNSAFAVAYLRLFGYDARTLDNGNNGFMHRKMLDEKETLSWHPFTEAEPHEYPYVTGN
jgi:rhodanese-related sulfurtransferase